MEIVDLSYYPIKVVDGSSHYIVDHLCTILYMYTNISQASCFDPRVRLFPGLIDNQGERLYSYNKIDSHFLLAVFFRTFCRLTHVSA